MAYLIDQIDNSGLFAQSAYSAGIATYDSLGNEITATYLTGVDLTPYQTTAGMTAYQPVGDYATTSQINDLSGAIDYVSANAGDQEVDSLVHTNSSTWDSVTNKLDTTAFSNVSGTFLTAHQSLEGYATEQWVGEQGYLTAVDLTPYQTTAEMTAYQPAGSYATTNDLEQVSADITATIPSTAGLASESYVQTNSAVLTGMIDAKQDALTFGYNEENKISAINNSAIAGGGSLTGDYVSGYNLLSSFDGEPREMREVYYSAVEVSGDVKLKTWYEFSGHVDWGHQVEKKYSLLEIGNSTANWNNVSDSYRNISANILTNSQSGTIKTNGHSLEATMSAISGDAYTITQSNRVYVSALPDYPYSKYTIIPNGNFSYLAVNYGTTDYEMQDYLYYDDNLPHDLPTTSGGKDLMWVQLYNGEVIAGEEQVVELQQKLTFDYDNDKISAINGSALAGGEVCTTYTSPSGTILINADTLEATTSAVCTNNVFLSALTFEYQKPIPENNDVDYYEFIIPYGKSVQLQYSYWSDYAQQYITMNQRVDNYSNEDITVRYPNWSADYYGDTSMSGRFSFITATPPNNTTAISAFSTETNVVELVRKSDFDNLYNAFTAYTASHP